MTRLVLAGLLIGLFGCDDPPRELPSLPDEATAEPAPPETTGPPPRFAEEAKVRLLRGSSGGWALAWPPAAVEEGEITSYVIASNGEELDRLGATARHYDLGEVPDGLRLYTVTAISSGNQQASLDFTMPTSREARLDLMNRTMGERLPGDDSLRFVGGG